MNMIVCENCLSEILLKSEKCPICGTIVKNKEESMSSELKERYENKLKGREVVKEPREKLEKIFIFPFDFYFFNFVANFFTLGMLFAILLTESVFPPVILNSPLFNLVSKAVVSFGVSLIWPIIDALFVILIILNVVQANQVGLIFWILIIKYIIISILCFIPPFKTMVDNYFDTPV